MRLRTLTAAVVALILLLIPDGAVQVNSKSFGFVEVITEEPEGLATEFYPLNENEAMYFTVHDGVVQGESTIQLNERDVIIQIKDEPLSLLRRRRGVAIASAAVELERVHDLVKSEIVRLEGEVRRAKRVSPRPSQQIIKRQYQHVFNGIAARVSEETIQQIEKLPQVKQVWTDGIVRASLSESVPLIRANQVWNSLGVTGHGITVAIIDTGIDYTHHDLGGCFGKGCKVIGGYDFVNRDNNPMDDHGHGTHVAGIVAANGMIKGVAPDANLMAFKVLDRYGRGMTSDVIAGIERAVDPDGNPATDDGVHVINLSLGGSGHPDDPLCQAVDNAVAAGVVVAVAAGNSGPSYETLESPGVARQAITVGASDKNNGIASFSSRGPAPITYQIKPEVLAPGVGITSTVPSGACSLCNSSGYQSLSGTSMATPHVAGTAALLLARFPIWTPEQVKEALMEQSISLLLNVYSQGSGRIDAYASATLLAIGSPGNLSLGLDDLSQPVFSVQKALNLTNLSTFSQTYGLSVQGGFDNRIMAKITPATLTLAPGQTGSFTFDLKLNNSEVPNVTNPPNAYEGNVVVKGGGETLAIPFTFIKSPILEVTFDEEPWMLNVHNRVNASWNISYPGLSRALLLPADVYDVIALFKDITTRVIREGVGVETKTTLKISKGEAVYPLTIVPIDKDGNPLSLTRSMGTSIFKHKTTGFGGTVASFYPSTTFRFSQVSNAYLFEATLLENRNPLGGPSYLFHGYARDGINGPLTFEYRPSDFKRVVTRHTGDPQVSEMVPLLFLGTRPEAPSSISMASCHFADPPLTAPFEEEAYYIPHPYPEFGVGFINKEIYSKPTSPCNLQGSNMFYTTPYLVARDQIQLDAFLWGEMNVPVFSTASELLPSGIGPDSWFGRFQNTPNFIQFEPALGSFHRFFLGQVRDFRPYNQLPYELFKDGSLIQSGSLTNNWISIGNPGTYTLRIPFSNYFISGQGGSAVMEAGFDTQKLDPNPPYLTQFTIMEDGDVTDTVVAGSGQAAFEVLDDKGIFQVDLIYSAGNGWRNLTVTNTGPGTYVANLPSFVADTFVSLRLLAADASGNSLSYEMNPAFFAKVETLSIPSKPNGPSSGDTETTYSYSTGGTFSQLGHKVQYLFDWGDGTNSGWLPVGTTTASKSWTDARTYSVTVQARCIKHTSSLSPWSEVLSVTINLPDTTPPAPNPMDWETPPFRTGTTSISMVATTATDPTTSILYYFDFVDSPSGGTGGNDSDWQSGTPYTNAGLQVNHQYGYRVKARDGANNETSYSTPIRYAYTAIEPPTGITFGTIAPTSIELQLTHTPSGLTRAASGLIIENTTHGTNSDWKQNNELWTSHSLSPNTLYSFRAKARNGDAIETGYCPSASRLTLANQPGTASFSNITQTCIRVNWTPNGNPDGTQYFCENTSMGTNSGWITETFWDSCGLVCGTSHSFRVKSRNRDGIESGWTSLGIQMTFVCEAITKPNLPSGPMKGATGIDYVYSTEGSKSNYGHSVQYLFDWGDGTNSGWLSIGTVSASKSWAAAGTFSVSVQARCVDHLSVISPWSESLTVKISIPVTVSLTSIGADDGRIRESHKGSGVGGSVSSSVLYVGDDSKDRQYKSILSFDTSGISPEAVILSATLKLKRRIHSGTNPFTTHGPCHVDVAKGTFGARTLQASDFQAFATASRVATLSNPAVDGAISIANLNASGLEALNKGGPTQMRIYFSMPYTDDNNSDYIGFYSGETNNPLANRPVLEVVYF